MTVAARAAPSALDAAARARVYAGAIEVVSGTPALRALVGEAWARVRACFAPLDPLFAYAELGNDAFFERFAPVRQGVPRDPELSALAARALVSLGLDDAYLVDRPRIRAVSSGAHDVPAAAAAYGQHRDSWYANPRAQINHWIPLHALLDEERMGFFPEDFDRAVPNGSRGFDLDAWASHGGFQAYARPLPGAQFHPTPEAPRPWSEAARFDVPFGHLLRFSGHHLHGTVPHRSGRTRYTLELRVVHEDDHRAGRGPADHDVASRGDAIRDYVRLAALRDPSAPGARRSR